MKKIYPAAALLLIFGTSYTSPISYPFTYRYEIRASSSDLGDKMMLYTYKNYLVQVYEEIVLKHPESTHDQLIRARLKDFEIDGKTKASLNYGTLTLTVGMGLGPSVKGDLRKNICDQEVIDTRFFFFEIFSN